MNDRIIGILGGMGPEATSNLFMKIIKSTQAKTDQDHFRVIIDSNVKIPDRTEFILGSGKSPVQAMIETGKNLEKTNVDIGCIPCITAHYFIEDIQKELSFPILNALQELNNYIKNNYPDTKKIGILATTGTIKTGLFEKYLTNMDIIYPTESDQKENVMEAIYGKNGIKSGNTGDEPLNLLKNAGNKLIKNGAEILISGCTEVSLVLNDNNVDKPLLDPMDIVAEVITK
ncbi:amino acid racemase [Clostridium sp. D2Q-14]|uniref:aspartate/glutamate racemase family protein n=1 Tax=Anaeromonas gelatinilytica TaxID=2683194 RepID=UPI00193BE21A|nr:amino acid racemase [Anaeromonas gelatinilytica]MBS4534498.1 amino acid racemase [Anaeromonas gelatinilytica]